MSYNATEKVYDLIGETVADKVEDWDTGEIIANAGDVLSYMQAHRIVFSGMFEDVQEILVEIVEDDQPWYAGMTDDEINDELDREYADYLHDSRIDKELREYNDKL